MTIIKTKWLVIVGSKTYVYKLDVKVRIDSQSTKLTSIFKIYSILDLEAKRLRSICKRMTQGYTSSPTAWPW